MTALQPADFPRFFHAVYGYDPFPWQARLAERVCNNANTAGHWPRCIALPTAAGKTACIDIAVFALACQAGLPPEKRTAPRRIFFVVDRRVVVDQAYDHAKELAEKLRTTGNGVLGQVAAGLQQVGADKDRPLDVYALRGGMYRESAWVRSPLQPTVITSTVDQVGSRLLFRGYGVSDGSKPLHAALVGNDALILLDEAHCARPFDQTMTLVRKYREWTDKPEDRLALPFHFVTMTATPGSEIAEDEIERLADDDRNDPELGKRIQASKPTRLIEASGATVKNWRTPLVEKLAAEARALKSTGYRAVGVIVNRVATARELANELRRIEPTGKKKPREERELDSDINVVLLTGRMRPVDRDAIMEKLRPILSGSQTPLERPTFVVATQTLEVGADLDFHALVTECASLDALRQRFGRLNRIAARDKAEATIVIRADQTNNSEDDPVYGGSLAKTWQWLNEHAEDQPSETPASATTARVIDFGIAAMEERTNGIALEEFNAPSDDAAVLLPAHLDMWCQTSPRPMPDPDPSYFLHGPQRGEPEVQVVFRADLKWDDAKSREENEKTWAEIVSLCPPSSSEALPVRLSVFANWLSGPTQKPVDDSSDVEGERSDSDGDDPGNNATPRKVLRWSGPELKRIRRNRDGQDRDDAVTCLVDSMAALRTGRRRRDVYVVPIAPDADLDVLGDFLTDNNGTPRITDTGDAAFQRSRDKAILRLRHDLYPVLDPSFDSLDFSVIDDDEAEAKVDDAIESLANTEDESVRRAVESLKHRRNRAMAPHPSGGVVLVGRHRLHRFDPTFVEPEDSWETTSDRPYLLVDHCHDVAAIARSNAERTGLVAHAPAIERAGQLHDIGKADLRFQAWLLRGNRRAVNPHWLLAKSCGAPQSRAERAASRARSGYPEGGRHELHSAWMATHNAAAMDGIDERQHDLVLHLIAAHHGYCRPFAPVIEDNTPESFEYSHNGSALRFDPDDSSISGHGLEHLGSGVAERFWLLTRRYGWWGLAYLEALLRLADWACVEPKKDPAPQTNKTADAVEIPA